MCYSAMVIQNLKILEAEFGAVTIRDTFAAAEHFMHADPKHFKPLTDRIFPNHFAAVTHQDAKGSMVVSAMRYQAWPPAHPEDPQKLSLYNARRDSLKRPFWSDMFMHRHGLLLVRSFFEWVAVKDLLHAGDVPLADIEAYFERQKQARITDLNRRGKTYRPTKTEKTPTSERKIMIHFVPEHQPYLIVPVIWAETHLPGSPPLRSFALITDEPPPEVDAAGHDRCPIHLPREVALAFLRPQDYDAAQVEKLLFYRDKEHFHHALPAAS